MNQIKFSSNYPKLHNQTEAKLVNVEIVSFFELTKELIEYDTKNTQGEYYPLPHTNLIHLTFLGNKLIPFCTIRRHTTQKWAYYKEKVGENFSIVLTSTQVSPSEKSDNEDFKKVCLICNIPLTKKHSSDKYCAMHLHHERDKPVSKS